MSLPTYKVPTRKNTQKVEWTTMIKNSKKNSFVMVCLLNCYGLQTPHLLGTKGRIRFQTDKEENDRAEGTTKIWLR